MTIIFIVLTLLILYAVTLGIIIKKEWGKKIQCNYCKNCCPACSPNIQKPLVRISRKKNDKILQDITFRIFDLKRYKCNHCAWEGLRY